MHSNSPLLVEIQTLKEELDSSKKTIDQYARLIAKLSVELENLRSSICQACNKRLVPCSISAPAVTVTAPSTDSHSPGSSSSPSTTSQGRAPVKNTSTRSPSDQSVIPNHNASELTTIATVGGSVARTTISPKPKSNLPEWSVIYNPKVETKALRLHLAHIFTYKSPVWCVNISPNGQRVAIGLEAEGKTYINEVRTGSNICVLVDRYTKGPLQILSIQFSPDGQLLATVASDNQIRLWDVTQRRMRSICRGHTDEVNSIVFSPNSRFLVSGSDDHSVRIWNIRDGSARGLIDDADWFLAVAFSPDGRYIAAGNFDSSLRIWDVCTTKLIAKWGGHSRNVWYVKFTQDGKGLVTGGEEKTFKYWDASSLGILQKRTGKKMVIPGQSLPEIRRFEGNIVTVRSVALFPRHCRWILTCSHDGRVLIWDMETGIWHLRLQGHTDWVRSVDVSLTENFLATASRDCRVTIWKYELVA